MNKLLITVQTANLVKLLLDKILHGLDIVVRGLLYLLHAGSILLTEVAVDITETVKDTVVEIGKLWQGSSQRVMKYSISTRTRYLIRAYSEK